MKEKKRIVLLAVVLMVAALGWEFAGRSYLLAEQVLVLKKDVAPNTKIFPEMVTTKRVEGKTPGALSQGEKDRIIGKESGQYIHAGAEVFKEYFVDSKLNPKAASGTKIFAIPSRWLESFPETLRRGDTVSLYGVGPAKAKEPVTIANVAHVKDKANEEILERDKERLKGGMKIETIEVILTNEQIVRLTGMIDYGTRFVLSYQ